MNVEINRGSAIRSVSLEGGLPCYTASDRESFLTAFQLTYRVYLRDGLAQPNRLGLRILPHQLLETSSVFLTTRSERVVGTLSLVEDGELGLPIESLYPTEIAQMRRRGRRLAELTCFALEETESIPRFSALRGLLRCAIRRAADHGIDVIAVCIHPDHAHFYERRLEFTRLGPLRYCPWVCHKPAVAMVRRLPRSATSGLADAASGQVISMSDARFQMALRECREYFSAWLEEASPIPGPIWRATPTRRWKDNRVANSGA